MFLPTFFLICNSDVCSKNKNCLEKEKVAKKTLASLQKEAVRHKNCNLKHCCKIKFICTGCAENIARLEG